MSGPEPFHALKEQVDGLRNREERLVESLDNIGKDVQVIKVAIVGDPTNSKSVGILTRIDRLEQTEKVRTRIVWALGSGVLALVLERVKALL